MLELVGQSVESLVALCKISLITSRKIGTVTEKARLPLKYRHNPFDAFPFLGVPISHLVTAYMAINVSYKATPSAAIHHRDLWCPIVNKKNMYICSYIPH